MPVVFETFNSQYTEMLINVAGTFVCLVTLEAADHTTILGNSINTPLISTGINPGRATASVRSWNTSA